MIDHPMMNLLVMGSHDDESNDCWDPSWAKIWESTTIVVEEKQHQSRATYLPMKSLKGGKRATVVSPYKEGEEKMF